MLADAYTSEQCEELLAANSTAARSFIVELSMVNQEHMQL